MQTARLGIFAAAMFSSLMVTPVAASPQGPAGPEASVGPTRMAVAPPRTPTPLTSPVPAHLTTSVSAFGSASSVPAPSLPAGSATVTAMAATSDGAGYWLATANGRVFATGDARSAGPVGALPRRAPIVAMAATPDAQGYWLAAGDGGVFGFGDAAFHGSSPGVPVVAMAGTPDGGGYWLVAADGGVLSFGDAAFHGSLGGTPVGSPIVALARSPHGGGYWLLAADGRVFGFGNARSAGPPASRAVPAVAIAATSSGYWVAFGHDPLGPPVAAFVAARTDNVTAAVYDVGTGELFTFRPGVAEHTASTVKLDILATLLQDAQAADRPLTAAEQADAVPMIEDSSDTAADALWTEVGPAAVGRFEGDVGMASTTPATDGVWGRTTTTAEDRIAAVRSVVFPNQVLTSASRTYILDLMEHITPSQDWGATGGVPSGVTVALKNGFSIIDGWQINTEGWVDGLGRNYVIAVLTDDNPSEDYGIQTVDGISAMVWRTLGG